MVAIKKAFLVNFIGYLSYAKHCSKYFNSLSSQESYELSTIIISVL